MRLGELLVNAGKLTPAQLDETLKGQAIFGGRFGTNLVEMGYLDEHELAYFLSKQTCTPPISPEQLTAIPPEVIKVIPEEYVRKYQVLPIALNNRKLTLAMVDPTDFAAIDEISFATGYIVVPVIAPELRMVTAMEKYYRIRREMRYISVEGGSRNRSQMKPLTAPHLAAPPPPLQPELAMVDIPMPPPAPKEEWLSAEDAEILDLPLLDELECLGDLSDLRQLSRLGEPEPMKAPAPEPAAPPAATEPCRKPEQDYSLEAVVTGLAQAEDRDSIADLIAGHLAQQFSRVGLFLLRGDKATGWVAQAGQKKVPGFESVEISLAEPSVLKIVEESRSYYLGPLPMTDGNKRLVDALGGGVPGNILLVPLSMMGRVVAVLYVDGGNSPLDQLLPELQKLIGKASMAFEILILKNKILMT